MFFFFFVRTGLSSHDISDVSSQSSYSELMSKRLSSRSCLKFREGNDDRNYRNLFISYGGNFWRCFVCLSFAPRALASKKMRACVTRDGTICAKNSPWNQSHYPRYPVKVSYPYYGSCLKACRIKRRKEGIIHLFVINNTCYYVNKTPMCDHWAAINATIAKN